MGRKTHGKSSSFKSRSYHYHRKMKERDKAKRMETYLHGYTGPFFGCPRYAYNKLTKKWEWVGGWVRENDSAKKQKKLLKRYVSRLVRRTEDVAPRCGYRRLSEYWWYLL